MLKLIKKNLISFICILLAVVMAVGGVISYAKFMSGENLGDTTGIGLFSYSASINGISAFTFTNTDFWGNADSSVSGVENMVAMNVIRTIDFEMKNFDGDKVNAVRTGYTMTYTSPVAFASSLALQVVDNDGTAMMPQIVVADILKGTSFSTADSMDYNGEKYVGAVYDKNGNEIAADADEGNDLYFVVTTATVAEGTSYTAKAKTPDGDFVITITPKMQTKEQTLNFRLWDVSALTDPSMPTFNEDGGRLIAPLTLLIEETQLYYDISISTPDFQFPAGIPTTKNHTLRLVPIVAIDDDHMGGLIFDSDGTNIDTLYSGQSLKLQNTVENIKTYSNSSLTGAPLSDITERVMGGVKIYKTGSVSTLKKTIQHTATRNVSDTVFGDSNPDWVMVDGSEIAGNITNVAGESYIRNNTEGTFVQNGTAEVTYTFKERREISYVVYEQTRVDSILETTEVLGTSTGDEEGHQKSAILKVTTSGSSTSSSTPVAIYTVVYERTATRTDNVSIKRTGTYTSYGYGYYDYTYETEWYITGTTSTGDSEGDSVGVVVDTMTEERSFSAGDGVDTSTNVETIEENTVYKSIVRNHTTVNITPKEISYTPIYDNGQLGEKEIYTSSSPFNIFNSVANVNGDFEQKYYVSRCFSKSYPMSVEITFEQRSANDS